MKYALIALLFASIHGAWGQKLEIHTNYNEAFKKAKAEKKMVLVDVYTDWCYWCKQLDKITYADSAVIEAINEDFIFLKLDAEQAGDGQEFAMRYGINSYPNIYYLNNKKQVVHITGGFMEPAHYLKELDTIVQLNKAGFYFAGYGVTTPSMPNFYTNYFPTHDVKRKRVKKSILDSFFKATGYESEASFLVMKTLGLGPETEMAVKPYLRMLGEKYPTNEVNNILDGILRNWVFKHVMDSIPPFMEIHELIRTYGPVDITKQDELIMTHTMNFHETRMDWIKYAFTYDVYTKQYGHSDGYYTNSFAWSIYENSTDTIALKMALNWMTVVIEFAPDYNHLDTYAALLYANGYNEQAEKAAGIAIEAGKKQDEDTKATEELLQLIKAQP